MSPTQIRKAVISAFGDVSNVSVVDATLPDPSSGEVQVRVIYSGFSGADINMRLGRYPFQRAAPLTPGYCLVGTVERIGSPETTSKFKVGDVVTSLTIYDSEATLANVPEKYVFAVPKSVSAQSATALVLDWNTAYGMVIHTAKVERGQRVFVHGVSGAVGYAIAALSRLQGAEVFGTASESKHSMLAELGITAFSYNDKRWMLEMGKVGGAHAVFDALGYESYDESYEILSQEGGVLVGYGGNQGTLTTGGEPRSIIWPVIKLLLRNLMFWSNKRTRFYYIDRDQKTFVPNIEALFKLAEAGKVTVPIKKVFDLEDIQDAHREWSKCPGIGSLLVKVSDEPTR